MSARVLVHIEDPGALNFLAPVPAELADAGIATTVLLDGIARRLGPARGIVAEPDDADSAVAALFEAQGFDFVLVGTSENPRSRAFDCLREATRRALPSAGVVDLPVNAAWRFRGTGTTALACAPRTILGGDADTLEAFAALGMPREQLVLVRNPRLDALAARAPSASERAHLRAARFPTFDSARPLVVFAAEPISSMVPAMSVRNDHYGLHGRGGTTYRTAIVLEELLDALASERPRPHVVVRLHPKNDPSEFAPYLPEIDALDAGGDPADLLATADLIVGMSSMILQEAVVMQLPTLSILPVRDEIERLPFLRRGLIPLALDRPTVRENVHDLLTTSTATGARPALDLGVSIAAFVREVVRGARAESP